MTNYTAFEDGCVIATGDMTAMITAQREALPRGVNLLIFDDSNGKVRDVDTRAEPAPAPTRGRPKLGVKAREVTLLPRHWDWLGQQRGGASAAIRRLVEDASRSDTGSAKSRQNATYAFLSSIAGDMPNYEEALRALFGDDPEQFAIHIESWPEDVRAYALRLLAGPRPKE